MPSQKPNRPKTPQIILLLRAAAGAYLLYLTWSLREDALSLEEPLVTLAALVFCLAGAALIVTSIRLLAKGEFLRPGELEESGQALEDGQDKEK